jgi:hypothetical protein
VLDGDAPLQEIFCFEYHPINGMERRLRVVLTEGSLSLYRIEERHTADGWERIDSEAIEYFEYSDEEVDTVRLDI